MLIKKREILNEDNTVGYIESIFESDNILQTTYFPKNEKLYISFSRGGTYSYSNISLELYNEFENADSHGKFFSTRINRNKLYPFRKEYSLYPTEITEIKKIINEFKSNMNENDEY